MWSKWSLFRDSAHDPIINSNTYNLELKCKWSGISIEKDNLLKSMG